VTFKFFLEPKEILSGNLISADSLCKERLFLFMKDVLYWFDLESLCCEGFFTIPIKK
jgi:hypothetical protein